MMIHTRSSVVRGRTAVLDWAKTMMDPALVDRFTSKKLTR